MNKSLGWTAVLGLTLCVVFLGLAFSKSRDTFDWLHNLGGENWLHGFDTDFAGEKPVAAAAGMKQWSWNGDSLEIDIPAKIWVIAPAIGAPAGPATIIVRGSPGILDKVRFSNGKLALASHQTSFKGKDHLEVSILGTFKQYALAVGELKLGHVEQDRLQVRISGAGSVDGDGTVNDLDLAISGVGNAEFGNLSAKTARVKISGAGNAEVKPSEEAEISLSGIGNVSLHSQPKKLTTHISGLGHVEGADGDRDDDRHG